MSDYLTDSIFFIFSKPNNWNKMPLYKKIGYYKTVLNRFYAPYVNKLTAKKIVKDLCGDKIHVSRVIRILNGPNDLDSSDLNIRHIIKSIHGSGWNINIDETTTIENSKKLLNEWNTPYLINGEKQYQYINPGFFIEEKIDDKFSGVSGAADVFMIRCIKGEPITIGVKRGTIQNSYTINWELLDKEQFNIDKPTELDRMIELSKILSRPFEFVRIDFYIDKQSNIYFSEFTFTPAAGYQLYPLEIEERLGLLWQ
jgi:hypothetical protein